MWLVALCLELAHEGGDTLIDQSIDLGLGDVSELETEHIPGLRDHRGEEPEEEDGV